MRKPYLARLGDLQAKLTANPPAQHGVLIRSFLAHEAMTCRNLKKSLLLTPALLDLLTTLPLTTFTGSLPYPPHYTLTTIYTTSNSTFVLLIYNQKTAKQIYTQSTLI